MNTTAACVRSLELRCAHNMQLTSAARQLRALLSARRLPGAAQRRVNARQGSSESVPELVKRLSGRELSLALGRSRCLHRKSQRIFDIPHRVK